MSMNEAQRQAISQRQRKAAAAMLAEGQPSGPPPEPPPPLRPLEEIAAETRPDVGPGMPVSFMRFNDRSFQIVGMQSGESVKAQRQPNGKEHRIELIRDLNCFLVTYLDPSQRKVEYDFVERSAVKTWRPA